MFVFFFFQAEDGIRDADVTGVQTCALPISGRRHDLARGVDDLDADALSGQRDDRLHGRTEVASSSAAGFSTTVPLKKSGLTSPQNRTALPNMKSRKSSSLSRPCSTSSCASGTTSAMSGTSKWPMSELNRALSRAPIGLAFRLNAHALTGSSASQPK